MFVFYKHDKSSIYEENAIHYPFNGGHSLNITKSAN